MKNKSIWHILTIICCCGMTISTLGLIFNSIGVFYSPLAESLGVGRGSVALFITISTLANGLAAPLFPRALKRFSLRVVLSAAIICAGAATMLLSTASSVWQLYVLGAIQGTSLAFFSSVPVTILITNWFEEKHGMATGIAFCFSGVAGAIFSPVFNATISAFGWRSSFILLGALVILFSLPGALFILKLEPAERGLLPFGAKAARTASAAKTAASGKTPLFTPAFIMLAGFALFSCFCTGPTQHLPGYAETVGLGTAAGAAMVSAAMIGNLSSKLLIGIISDMIGPIYASVAMFTACAAALLTLIFLPHSPMLVLLIAGILSGCIYSVGSVGIPLVTKYFFGAERYSSVYPNVAVISNIGSASAIAIIGYIYDFTHSYNVAFFCCIAFLLTATVLLMLLKRNHERSVK